MERLVERLRALDVADDPLALLNGGPPRAGSARLLPCTDGWVALSLFRPDDLDLVPAWLGVEPRREDIAHAVRQRTSLDLVDGATLLGLPVSSLGETTDTDPCRAVPLGSAPPVDVRDLTVVDLSSLWAGPLCSMLLARRGARVVKVESAERPDGARAATDFFERLNDGKEQRTVPLAAFGDQIAEADVVIEASRPRALAQLGIDAEALVRSGGPRVWLSITGHGRDSNRVGFGDDTAVAGGLVTWRDGEPRFYGHAIADPCTGMVATSAVLDALARGGRWLLDVAMARVAASLAAP